MPANLDAIDFGADVVCVVDHPMGQPQQPLFDDFQVVRHDVDLPVADFARN